jgi:hypothetical protein
MPTGTIEELDAVTARDLARAGFDGAFAEMTFFAGTFAMHKDTQASAVSLTLTPLTAVGRTRTILGLQL